MIKHPTPDRLRLDQLLVVRGLVPTRSRARDLVLRGEVSVSGERVQKPSQVLAVDADVSINQGAARFVSRGALKLVGALDGFGFDACGVRALDVGASTGGFTQVLLERGADEVVAVDVGRGQLAPVIAADRRVVSFENTDARQLAALGERVRNRTAFVCDVSFISVLKVLPQVLPLAGATAWLVVLVKPQFEVGRAHIGKGGIVRDEEQRLAAVRAVETYLTDQPGWRVTGHIQSGIVGGDGNQEYLVGATYE